MQRQSYQITSKTDSRRIAEFLSQDGQLLLPFLELICNTEQAVDDLIDVAGKAAIEAVLLLSAQQLAGPKQPGKSQISREFAAASEQQLKTLCERRFDEMDILIMYIDGIPFGDCHVIVAIGVDSGGSKHVLGLREGSRENGRVATDLLTDLVERGVKPDRPRLFVIDGSKALRCAIDAVYGCENPVRRCRKHKIRNVLGYLPEDQKDQAKAAMQAAFLLDADKGIKKLKPLAKWFEPEYPSAAASLLEGLEEMFTINRLGLPKALRRCLGSTNVIESPNSGIRSRTRRVKNWRDHAMVVRWVAAALLDMEKRFKRIMGYQQLWVLDAKLKELAVEDAVDHKMKVA